MNVLAATATLQFSHDTTSAGGMVVAQFEIEPSWPAMHIVCHAGCMSNRSSNRGEGHKGSNRGAHGIVQEAAQKKVVDIQTGEKPAEKNPAAVSLGRLGGLRGGLARASKLSPERRREIAQAAARKRWNEYVKP